jgi:hypothetical protein
MRTEPRPARPFALRAAGWTFATLLLISGGSMFEPPVYVP